jgi:hypothetical protein
VKGGRVQRQRMQSRESFPYPLNYLGCIKSVNNFYKAPSLCAALGICFQVALRERKAGQGAHFYLFAILLLGIIWLVKATPFWLNRVWAAMGIMSHSGYSVEAISTG